MKNALNTLQFEARTVQIAKTGYTGEPLGYEVYIKRRKTLKPAVNGPRKR